MYEVIRYPGTAHLFRQLSQNGICEILSSHYRAISFDNDVVLLTPFDDGFLLEKGMQLNLDSENLGKLKLNSSRQSENPRT